MALSTEIISLLRDEVGDDTDFVDNIVDFDANQHVDSLENIYTDTDRGNFTILGTAVIVWRRRYANHVRRAFDVSKEGNWYARSQQTRYLAGQVARYEALVGQGRTSRNQTITSEAESAGLTSSS
jgi:hypothetical protein